MVGGGIDEVMAKHLSCPGTWGRCAVVVSKWCSKGIAAPALVCTPEEIELRSYCLGKRDSLS